MNSKHGFFSKPVGVNEGESEILDKMTSSHSRLDFDVTKPIEYLSSFCATSPHTLAAEFSESPSHEG